MGTKAKQNTPAKSISWNQLADIHDHVTGDRARTMPMEVVATWAESRDDLFRVDEEGFFIPTEKARKFLTNRIGYVN